MLIAEKRQNELKKEDSKTDGRKLAVIYPKLKTDGVDGSVR